MGQILSNSEVEAILSSLDFTSTSPAPKPPSSAPTVMDLPFYDFEHPEPLRRSHLEYVQRAASATTQNLQNELGRILRTSVAVTLLGVEQSTFRDYLATAEVPGCLAVFESSSTENVWLLEIGRTLAFTLVDCMLGGKPTHSSSSTSPSRPFSDVEARLIGKAIFPVLPELASGIALPTGMQMPRLVSDGSFRREASSNEAVVLLSFEVACGSTRGLMQLCVPWRDIASISPSSCSQRVDFREAMRAGAIKMPVIAKVCVARLKLSTQALSTLNPGDVLVTDVAPENGIVMEVDGQAIFHGTPGKSHNRKVILLTAPAANSRASETSADSWSIKGSGAPGG